MKKLDTSFITSTAAQPIKKGTLEHLQSAYQEAIDAICQGITKDKTKINVLFGCINSTPGGGTFTISAGAVYYNGEIYLVDAATLTPGGGQVVVGVLDTTFFTGSTADPVKFTDNNTHSVHQIRKIKLQNGATGTGITSNSDSDFTNFIPMGWSLYTIAQAKLNPFGATITSGSGSFKYKVIGKTLHFQITFQIIFTGTAVSILVDLADVFVNGLNLQFKTVGGETSTLFEAISFQMNVNASTMTITRLTGASIAAGTYNFFASGTLEIQ